MITFTPYASSSAGNLYTVTDGTTTVMLDCGLPWRKVRELLRFNTSVIDAVMLTHSHGDHTRGAVEAAKSGLDIYASRETLEAVKIPAHRGNEIPVGKVFSVGSWHILTFETVHDAEGSLGFYMVNFEGEAFLYLTDSAYSIPRFNNLVVMAVECNFMSDLLSQNILNGTVPAAVGRRTRRTHMSLETLIALIKANDLSKCRAVYLLHMSAQNSDEAKMIKAVQQALGVSVYAA